MTIALYIAGLVIVSGLSLVFAWLIIRRRTLSGSAKIMIQKKWNDLGKQSNPTLKIVAADIILGDALSLLGYDGSVGEKLKLAGPRFTKIDALWKAHKLRNSLVHDLTIKPSDKDVKSALREFERALKELGM